MGVVMGAAGQPIGSVSVLACSSMYCLVSRAGVDGTFMFSVMPPVDLAVKVPEDLTTTPRRGEALVPVQVVDDSLVNLGAVYVPNLPDGVPLGPASIDPQALMVGDGLELTVNRADLLPPPGQYLSDLAATMVPATHVYTLPELGTEQIIGVYALHPFAATSQVPIAVRAPYVLPAGTPVNFRTISDLDGQLSAPAHGLADGAFVKTEPGGGIAELTWLIISK
jgi:hypothetical protein